MTDEEFQDTLQRLDELVQEFDALPYPAVREKIFDALGAIDAVHREALRHLIEFIHQQGHAELVLRAAHDPVVRTLLDLYDFLPGESEPAAQPVVPTRNFIPLAKLGTVQHPVVKEIARVGDIPPGQHRVFDVDRMRILVANVDGEIYAIRNNCPGSAAPLNLGRFQPPLIVCPWHNETWDIRTGKRVDGQPGRNLEVLSVTVSDGIIKIPVDETATASIGT